MKVNSVPTTISDVINVLRRNNQLRLLAREITLDQHLADIHVSKEAQLSLLNSFRESQDLVSDSSYYDYLTKNFLDEPFLISTLVRAEKISIFREDKWSPLAKSIYLKDKEKYDQVSLFMLTSQSENVMQEVYFRIKDGEETWNTIAKQLSASTPVDPKIGPVAVQSIPFVVRKGISESGKGKITPPLYSHQNSTYYLAELIDFHPATFDDQLKQKIVNEQFELWLQKISNDYTSIVEL